MCIKTCSVFLPSTFDTDLFVCFSKKMSCYEILRSVPYKLVQLFKVSAIYTTQAMSIQLCIILYYTILYYTILHYTVLYYTTLYCIILYYTILYYTTLYCIILYYTILYYTILHYSVLYYINLPERAFI